MHHISAKSIPISERRTKLSAYLSSLKRQLLNPGLTDLEREKLLTEVWVVQTTLRGRE